MKKIKILAFLSICSLFMHPLHANFDEIDTFVVARYNSLPAAEEADDLLKTNNKFPSFLEEAQSVAENYNFQSFFGFRLLHKHTVLEDDLKLVESTQMTDSGFIFTTRPFNQKERDEDIIVPASWIATESGYQVFEYSSDAAMVPYYEQIKRDGSDFLQKIHTLLYKYELQNLISPTIVGTAKQLEAPDGTVLVEETYYEPFQSIISLTDISTYKEDSLIQTLWSLSERPKEAKCVNRCVSQVVCRRNPRTGHHDKQPSHNSKHLHYRDALI